MKEHRPLISYECGGENSCRISLSRKVEEREEWAEDFSSNPGGSRLKILCEILLEMEWVGGVESI
jgi:hypothetical protein